MDSRSRVEVCFTPNLYPLHMEDADIVVVIDVLRATSAICTAFDHGVKKVIPGSTLEEAIDYRKKGFIVGAERNGEIVPGFEYGNSPFSYAGDHVKDKTIVLSTTNGTFAIAAAQKSHQVIIASFLNLDAVSEWLAGKKRRITLICAGWKNKFNLEDSLLAGAIADQLIAKMDNADPSDSAIAAQRLYQLGKNDLMGYLEDSSHRRRLKKLFIEKDVEYCLTPNQTDAIPILEAGSIVKLVE